MAEPGQQLPAQFEERFVASNPLGVPAADQFRGEGGDQSIRLGVPAGIGGLPRLFEPLPVLLFDRVGCNRTAGPQLRTKPVDRKVDPHDQHDQRRREQEQQSVAPGRRTTRRLVRQQPVGDAGRQTLPERFFTQFRRNRPRPRRRRGGGVKKRDRRQHLRHGLC